MELVVDVHFIYIMWPLTFIIGEYAEYNFQSLISPLHFSLQFGFINFDDDAAAKKKVLIEKVFFFVKKIKNIVFFYLIFSQN